MAPWEAPLGPAEVSELLPPRRVGFEDEDRECRLVVAEDARSGQICGCLDLAVHLYDRDQQRFFLTVDRMPEEAG